MINIFWFRRDLRLNDNHGLWQALKSGMPVLPIFIFDTNILEKLESKDDPRITFIHEEISGLKRVLQKEESSLLVFRDTPEKAFKALLERYKINAVYANEDYEPYAKERDKKVGALLAEKEIELKLYKDQVIFAKDEVVKDDGDPYSVFTPYSKKWRASFDVDSLESYRTGSLLDKLYKTKPLDDLSLEEIGFSNNSMDWPSRKIPKEVISKYDKTRDYPYLEGTSRLGIHLRFGTISVRELVKTASDLNSTYLNELIWREFYMMIIWHHPEVVDRSFKPEYDHIPWRNNESEFEAWQQGRTGYPLVDAGMRQLLETGYMHNRVRMVTASFLTKHLLIDWRWGEAWFASKLLDYELSSNNGGWQWAAGSGCDAAPYFRIFNPESQAKKFDPEQRYIRHWIQEIDDEHYPEPIVEHSFARERALETYAKTLKSHN